VGVSVSKRLGEEIKPCTFGIRNLDRAASSFVTLPTTLYRL